MKVLLIAYDDDAYIHRFPLGLAYIASALRKAGHEVEIYSQDMYHYPESHLANYLAHNHFDVVGLGFCAGYWQYQKMLKISAAIKFSLSKPVYILGGHGPSPEPEYFLRKSGADAVIIGEGDITVVNLLDALEHNRSLSSVKGIAYLDGGKLIVTERQGLVQNLDTLLFPAWDLFPMDYYSLQRFPHIKHNERSFPMLTSRGCLFRCNFCYRMDKGLRLRSPESVIEELRILKRDYRISYITFYDELLMSSPERVAELCEAFIKAKLNIRWFCNGRLNWAMPKILKIMKEAGCVAINYGIESMDDTVLRLMNKRLTTRQVTIGIEATLAEGISPIFNFIFGSIGDTPEILQRDVEFLSKYDDYSQISTIRPVTPYPGCDLYYYSIEHGLLKDVADFYEHKHTNSDLLTVNLTNLSDGEFHRLLLEANKTLVTNYNNHQLKENLDTIEKLYLGKDASFRGYRHNDTLFARG